MDPEIADPHMLWSLWIQIWSHIQRADSYENLRTQKKTNKKKPKLILLDPVFFFTDPDPI